MRKGNKEMMDLGRTFKHVLLRMKLPDFYRLHASAEAHGQSLNLHTNRLIRAALKGNQREGNGKAATTQA